MGIPFSMVAAASLVGGKVTGAREYTDSGRSLAQNSPIRRNALVWALSSPPPGTLVPLSSPVLPLEPSAATTPGVGGFPPSFSSCPVLSNSPSSGRFQSLPDGSFRRADTRKRWRFSSSTMPRGQSTVPSALRCDQMLIRNKETRIQNLSRPSLPRSSRRSRSKRPTPREVGWRWWQLPVCASVF